MANFSAIMILFRFYVGMPLLIIIFLSLAEGSSQSKSKRQIYREQVLPSSGGKIPEGAFRADRLALNRLNKEGISVPDGVLLEHRHVHSHPHSHKHDPEDEDSLVKIIQRPDHRFVPPEGTYHNERPLTVSSTYIIRKPIGREETNIRTPDQQMPLHEYLSHRQMNQEYPSHPESYPQPPWAQQQFEQHQQQQYGPPEHYPSDQQQPPPPSHPEPLAYHPSHHENLPAPVSYQHLEHSVAYYPIPVPFELPNKENIKDEYYFKDHRRPPQEYEEPEDIHSVIGWPYLLGQYTQLADELNGIIQHGPYKYQAPHPIFFTPQVVTPFASYYYRSKDRYVRKSKESYANAAESSDKSKDPKTSRRLVKLRCRTDATNTVDDHSTKCQVKL